MPSQPGGGDTPRKPSRTEPKTEKELRDARLAEALRANLKRRKAGQGKPAKPDPEPGEG